MRHWITNGEAGIVSRGVPGSNPDVVGNVVYGSKGYLSTVGGYKIFLGKEQQPGPAPEATGAGDNWANFIQAVRSRKHSDLNAPVEEGAPSVVLIHLANISYRLGRTLHLDAATMTCKGDAEATGMFTRAAYRAPFIVPEKARTALGAVMPGFRPACDGRKPVARRRSAALQACGLCCMAPGGKNGGWPWPSRPRYLSKPALCVLPCCSALQSCVTSSSSAPGVPVTRPPFIPPAPISSPWS